MRMSGEMAVMDSYIDGTPIAKSLLQMAKKDGVPKSIAKELVSALTSRKHSVLESLTLQYNRDRVCEPLITRDVEKTAASIGAVLEGTLYSVKTGTSVGDRLARAVSWQDFSVRNVLREQPDGKVSVNPGKLRASLSTSLSLTRDIVRYTEIVDHDSIPDKTLEMIKKMKEEGYVHCFTKNYFTNPFPSTGYMGIHTNFVSPYGQIIEIQVHSAESFAAKQKGHALYEELRSNFNGVEDKEKKYGEIRAIHQAVPLPAGYDKVHDTRMPGKKVLSLVNAMRDKCEIRLTKRTGRKNLQYTLFSVCKGGKECLNGFDVRFPDGDAWAYRKDARDPDARFESIRRDPRGEGVAETRVTLQKPVDFNLAEVARIAEKWLNTNKEWMKEHFPHGYTLDDINMENVPEQEKGDGNSLPGEGSPDR